MSVFMRTCFAAQRSAPTLTLPRKQGREQESYLLRKHGKQQELSLPRKHEVEHRNTLPRLRGRAGWGHLSRVGCGQL